MIPQIEGLGFMMTPNAAEADLILVNTCGFLETAVQEAIETILDAAAFKKKGRCTHLVVAGCMVQRYGKKLPDLLPEVDLFVGASHYLRLSEVLRPHLDGRSFSPPSHRVHLGRPRELNSAQTTRSRSTPPHSAYVKVADGCSNHCTFCMIPRLRGPYRSRSVPDILHEINQLADEGVKEINLIAQDTAALGTDRGDPDALLRLLEALEEIPHPVWMRLLYLYPERLSPPLLQVIGRSSKVMPYLDIPFQHSVPHILRTMRGNQPSTPPEEVVASIRSHIPEIALRTSLMVGFPGETEKDFEALCNFVQSQRFHHVGVFAFSPEPGTRAARMSPQIPVEIKEKRKEILLILQREISRRHMEELVGKTRLVLVEGTHPETDLLLIGRLAIQAPEVDGSVLITRGETFPGAIVPALITQAHDYDVEAELLPSDGGDGCPVDYQVTIQTLGAPVS